MVGSHVEPRGEGHRTPALKKIRASCEEDVREISKIIQERGEKEGLIAVLHAIQRKKGYLSEEALILVARGMKLPLSKVYGVATFYSLFSTKPKGENVIRLCESAPCYVKGGEDISEILREELGIGPGGTTPDRKFTLEFVSCLGICGVAPAMMINDTVYGNLTRERVKEILKGYRGG